MAGLISIVHKTVIRQGHSTMHDLMNTTPLNPDRCGYVSFAWLYPNHGGRETDLRDKSKTKAWMIYWNHSPLTCQNIAEPVRNWPEVTTLPSAPARSRHIVAWLWVGQEPRNQQEPWYISVSHRLVNTWMPEEPVFFYFLNEYFTTFRYTITLYHTFYFRVWAEFTK